MVAPNRLAVGREVKRRMVLNRGEEFPLFEVYFQPHDSVILQRASVIGGRQKIPMFVGDLGTVVSQFGVRATMQ